MTRQPVRFWICTALALALWCAGCVRVQELSMVAGSVGLYYQDGGLTAGQRDELLKTEKLKDAVLWRETPNQTVREVALDRSVSLDLLELRGDGSRLLVSEYLRGVPPPEGDLDGCSLSSAAAQALWGSSDVLGKEILLEGRPLIVRGVFQDDKLYLLAQSHRDDTVFSHVELNLSQNVESRSIAERLLIDTGLPLPDGWLDGPLLCALLRNLVLVPAWGLALTLAGRFFLRAYRVRRCMPLLLLALVLAGAATAVFFWCAQLPTGLPDRFLPGRWSDFEFWSRTIKSILPELIPPLSRPASPRDLILRSAVLSCVFLVLITVFLLILAGERADHIAKHPVLAAGAAMLLLFFLLRLTPGGAELPRAVWLGVPVFLWGCKALHGWDGFLSRLINSQKGGCPDETPCPDSLDVSGTES